MSDDMESPDVSDKAKEPQDNEDKLPPTEETILPSEHEDPVCPNGLEIGNKVVNGTVSPSAEAAMDAVLEEESDCPAKVTSLSKNSQSEDKVMSPSKNGQIEDKNSQSDDKVMSPSENGQIEDKNSQSEDRVMSPSKNGQIEDKKSQVVDKNIQYTRLISLLTKSQFYTEFLVKKLDQNSLKKGSPRKGRRKLKECNGDDPGTGDPAGSHKSHQSDSQRVMEIAADVISNKKSGEAEETVPEEDLDLNLTKTLKNGLVVPLNQPKILEGACLRDYQMEGLGWLKLLFENGVNGILADEMGLGKTIQVIALVCHLIEKNIRGPFLIIGPLSTLPNWAIEFERFAPQIPVVVYHGPEEKRKEARKKMGQKKVIEGHKVYPVILTSFDYPLRDVKYLRKVQWRYIIIDEGHRLKNHNSQLSKALRQYTSANRLLLTGTPLHNSLSELWALLNFLVPEIFDDLEIFESWFRLEDLASEGGSEKVLEEEKKTQVLSTMHKILSPFMLRRVKSQVQLNLPPKKELVVYAPMTPLQLDLYRAVLDYNVSKLRAKEDEKIILETEDGKRLKRSCTQTKKYYVLEELFDLEDASNELAAEDADNKTLVVQDKENSNFAIRVKMQNSAMMLRKIVNHPYLVQYPLEPGTAYARIDEDLVKTSGKLQVLDAMLTKLKERGHKVLLFSTFTSAIDILEDYLSLRSFKYVRLDGSTGLDDRQVYIKQYNSDPNLFLFLISTRAGGLGINLASADTVIIFDSDWNPQVDLQAQDRCHRIGQTRPVVVYRFVTAGTVDERIVVRAAAKRKLEKIIIHKGNYSSVQKPGDHGIDLEELKTLLSSRDHHRVIHPNGYVFSDEELDALLDRSDLINGKSSDPTADNGKLEERSFKEYYGYTGVKQVSSKDDEASNNVQIVDQDSNDASYEPLPVRRSPVKKCSSFENQLPPEPAAEKNGQVEDDSDCSSLVSDSSKKRRASPDSELPTKKHKSGKTSSSSSSSRNEKPQSTSSRRTRARK